MRDVYINVTLRFPTIRKPELYRRLEKLWKKQQQKNPRLSFNEYLICALEAHVDQAEYDDMWHGGEQTQCEASNDV